MKLGNIFVERNENEESKMHEIHANFYLIFILVQVSRSFVDNLKIFDRRNKLIIFPYKFNFLRDLNLKQRFIILPDG